MYVAGPDGTRICTTHNESFRLPASCPQCRLGKPESTRARSSSMAPEIGDAIAEEVVMFEGLAEDAAEIMANAVTDRDRIAALKEKRAALSAASALRMRRAEAAHLDRLKERKPAAAGAIDPRDAFDDLGTAAADEMAVAGDN